MAKAQAGCLPTYKGKRYNSIEELIKENNLETAIQSSINDSKTDSSMKIQYTKEFMDDVRAGKRDYNLKYGKTYEHGQLVTYVEAVINPYSSKFMINGKMLDVADIDKINSDALKMLGMRIPTEGMQSMVLIKVVGFMNNAASVAMFPDELISQTGHDFDIDSIYIYYRNLEVQSDALGRDVKINIVPYYEDEADGKRYEAWKLDRRNGIQESVMSTLLNNGFENSLERKTALKKELGVRMSKARIAKSEHNKFWEDSIATQKGIIDIVFMNMPSELKKHFNREDFTELNDLLEEFIAIYDNDVFPTFGKLENKKRAKQHYNPRDYKTYRTLNSYMIDEMSMLTDKINLLYDEIELRQEAEEISDEQELIKIKTELKKLNKRINAAKDEIYKEIYDSLNDEEKNTRAARENRIIDVFESILKDEKHLPATVKPNSMEESVDAATFINNLYGEGDTEINLFYYSDMAGVRDINMSIRQLKANVVGTQGVMAALGKIKAHFKHGISVVLTPKQVGNRTLEELQTIVGVKNVIKVGNNYQITSQHLNNNAIGTWNDILGVNISSQAAQTTSHILDAVKELMGFNINEHTLPVYMLMVFSELSMLFNNAQNELTPNKFILPNLFIHQPILIEYVNKIVRNQIDQYSSRNGIPGELRNEYIVKLINAVDISATIKELAETKYKIDADKEVYIRRTTNIIDKAKKDKKLSDEMLDIVKDISEHYENNKLDTFTKLLENIELRDSNIVKFYARQLNHLDTFQSYNAKAGSIISAVATVNTDKKKLGPDASDTSLIIDKIKLEYEKALDEHEADVEDSTVILVNDEPLLGAIYPKFLGLEKESVYPIYEAYLEHGAKTALDVMIALSPLNSPVMRRFKEDVLSNIINSNKRVDIENAINGYATFYFTPMSEYFKFDEFDTELNEQAKILNLKARINGTLAEWMDNHVSWETVAGKGEIHLHTSEQFEKFKVLSLTNKLNLIKKSKRHSAFINDPSYKGANILNVVYSLDSRQYYNKHLSTNIGINKIDVTKDFTIDSFIQMFYGKDIFLKDIALDLLRHTYFNHGLNFGNNISKFIPVDILFDGNEIIGTYAQDLYALKQGITEQAMPEFIKNFYKSHSSETALVPTVNAKNISETLKSKLINFVFEDNTGIRFIPVNQELLNQSHIGNAPYITISSVGEKTLMKRYEFEDSINPIDIFVPISKLNAYEREQSSNILNLETNLWNEEIDGAIYKGTLGSETEMDKIVQDLFSSSNFRDIAINTNASYKSQQRDAQSLESADISVSSHNSQTEAVKEMAKNYDTIYYVGDENSTEFKLLNSKVALQPIPFHNAKQVAREINKKNKTKIAIIGNIPDSKDNRAQILEVIERIQKYNPNLERIGTLSNSNISSVIKRATTVPVDLYTSNEYIPSLIKTNVLESQDLLEEDSQTIALSQEIKSMQSALDKLYKLNHKYRQSAAPFRAQLETIIEHMTKDKIQSNLNYGQIATLYGASINVKEVLTLIQPHLNDIIDELRKYNMNTIVAQSQEEHNKVVGKILEGLDLIAFADIMAELNELEYTSIAEQGEAQIFRDYNNLVKEIKQLREEIDTHHKSLMIHAKSYMTGIVSYNSSNNTKFITRFEKEFKDFTLTDFTQNMLKMLENNEDITVYQLWLDTIFSTGVSMIDNMMLEYAKLLGEQYRERTDLLDAFVDAYAATFGAKYLLNPQEVTKGEVPKYDRKAVTNSSNSSRTDRSITFKTRLLDGETGRLVSEYDYYRYFKEERAKRNAIYKLQRELARETSIGNNPRINYLDQQIKDAWNKYNEWYDKTNLSKETESSKLSDQELIHLEKLKIELGERKFKQYLKREHIATVQKFQSRKGRKKSVITYRRIVLDDTYKNAKYEKLSQQEKDLLKLIQQTISGLLQSTYNEFNVTPDFFPLVMPMTLEAAIVENFLGWQNIKPSNLSQGITNELYRVYDPPMMSYIQYQQVYEIPFNLENESDKLEKVNKEVAKRAAKDKNARTEPFKSYEEILTYNEEIEEINRKKTIEKMITDPYAVMSTFISMVLEHKKTINFANRVNVLRYVMRDPAVKFHKKVKGRTITVLGKETNAYKRLEGFIPTLHGDSKVKKSIDKALSAMKQWTSLTYMGFNITGGIKNIMHGYGNELMESVAGEFTTRTDLRWAMKTYLFKSTKIIGAIGSEYSDDVDVAIMKRFGNLLDLKNEEAFERNEDDKRLHRFLMASSIPYFMNNMTEHFMQYTMLLGVLKSSRIVKGRIMNFTQYASETRLATLKKVLSNSAYADLIKWLTAQKKSNPNYSNNPSDYIRQWVLGKTDGTPNLTREEKRNYNKEILIVEKGLQEEFLNFDSAYDQFEVKNGRAVLKENAKITNEEVDLFQQHVHKLNQSLHGIYNRIDRHMLKDTILGDLAFQFRSWMRPNWNRFFGVRFGKSTFNEGLRSFRKGAFISLGEFLASPIIYNYQAYKRNDIEGKQVFARILSDYKSFFSNVILHWRSMSLQDRQNAWRALANLLYLANIGLLLTFIGFLDDDDEEQAYMTALLIYELNATFTDTSAFIPIVGWMGTLSRTKQYTMASERVIIDNIKMMWQLLSYPFASDKSKYYRSGMYKGKSRLGVSLMKNTPIVRQGHKFQYIPYYTKWYELHNPFTSLIPKL